jgi:uncharacterized membrane protein YfcA
VVILALTALVGFVAQMIDGSVGMAFGVTATSFLLIIGYGPAMASAVVHLAEIGTTLASGTFHLRFGNVDRRVLLLVAIPGAVGAFFGATVLTSIDLSAAKPWTAALLLALGVLIIVRFSRPAVPRAPRRPRAAWLLPLGLFAGFVDASGGGGWGPIMTTTLTASDSLTSRRAIGTTNTAEFLVSVAASAGFLVGLGAASIQWTAVLALLVGGILAAPIAAKIVSVAPQRILGLITGVVVVILNTRQLGVSLEVSGEALFVAIAVAVLAGSIAITAGVRRQRADLRQVPANNQVEDLSD